MDWWGASRGSPPILKHTSFDVTVRPLTPEDLEIPSEVEGTWSCQVLFDLAPLSAAALALHESVLSVILSEPLVNRFMGSDGVYQTTGHRTIGSNLFPLVSLDVYDGRPVYTAIDGERTRIINSVYSEFDVASQVSWTYNLASRSRQLEIVREGAPIRHLTETDESILALTRYTTNYWGVGEPASLLALGLRQAAQRHGTEPVLPAELEERLAPRNTLVISCALCPQAALHQCSACKAVAYCGEECQRRHWTEHASQCTGKQ